MTQLGLDTWAEMKGAAEDKRRSQEAAARRAGKGAETSRAALHRLAPMKRGKLEALILEELEARGPGTADQLGRRLFLHAPEGTSDWGPQTMSGRCNRLLKDGKIIRRRKDRNPSGSLAWVWELRDPSGS